MMLKTNVQCLCENLDLLLKEICDYLTEQIDNENLTENQRLLANKLIQRSKKQLHEISKVSVAISADVDDQSYVDMNKQSVVEEATYEEEINEYTPIGCAGIPIIEEEITCPYESLPAAELEKCEKFGNLDRKERFLFIGHQKRLLAGIKENWLLIYGAKKDQKPANSLNLTLFVAQPSDSSKTKSFDLICKRTQKTFQFAAQTPKDMIQWVACINKKSSIKEENHNISPADEDEDEEENMYEPLKINDDVDTLKKKSKPLPPLPKSLENTYVLRNTKQETQLIDSDMENYDPICAPNNRQAEEEEEEDIYDVIQEVKSEKPPASKIADIKQSRRSKLDEIKTDSILTNSFSEDDEEDRIYDVLEQTVPSKPAPKHIPRPVTPESEEEYCNLVLNENNIRKVSPPKPPARISTTNSTNKAVSSYFEAEIDNSDEDEEAEYHCVLSTKDQTTERDVQSARNLSNSRIENDVPVEKIKKIPPALKPKPKVWRKS